MNFSIPPKRPRFRLGLQRYALFFNLQTFLQKFLIFFFSVSLSVELPAFTATRFSKGMQRYTLFSNLQTFLQRFSKFIAKSPLRAIFPAKIQDYSYIYRKYRRYHGPKENNDDILSPRAAGNSGSWSCVHKDCIDTGNRFKNRYCYGIRL